MRVNGIVLLGGSIVIIPGLFAFAMVNGGFLSWFLFYFYLAVFLYEMVTWFSVLNGIDAQRTVSATRLSAGQTLEVRVTLQRNRSLWPLIWLRIGQDLPRKWRFQAQGVNQVVQPLWAREVAQTYHVLGLERGVYVIGQTVLESGDVLGLLRRHRVFPHHHEVIVYPSVVAVRGWTGKHPEEAGLRQPTRRRAEESSNVLGVRDYVPGDRLSRIHWPASARRGRLQAKEFELHVTGELLFIPDLSQLSFREHASLFELEMTVVASLMKYAYELHRRFGAALHAEKLTSFPAGTNEALFLRCMEALAMANPTGKVDFAQSLVRIAQEAPRGSTLVVVSPRLDREVAVAAAMARRNASIEWFGPLDHGTLDEQERTGLRMLQAGRVNVHLIRSAEQLASLQRGGVERATGV